MFVHSVVYKLSGGVIILKMRLFEFQFSNTIRLMDYYVSVKDFVTQFTNLNFLVTQRLI